MSETGKVLLQSVGSVSGPGVTFEKSQEAYKEWAANYDKVSELIISYWLTICSNVSFLHLGLCT